MILGYYAGRVAGVFGLLVVLVLLLIAQVTFIAIGKALERHLPPGRR